MQLRLLFTYGFALFAMFFGSGNLVFPILVGQQSGSNWLFGLLGLIITGVFLPFIGLFVIKLYNGKYEKFFASAGKIGKFLIPFFTLSLLGSFGVVPRCITVAHGGINFIDEGISLVSFSAIFVLVSYFLCLKDKLLVNILGKLMSPILLGTLVILIACGIYYGNSPLEITTNLGAAQAGFVTGYQTMDLFAAFFFSSFIFQQIQESLHKKTQSEQIRFAVKSSLIASILLALIYTGFVYLGAHYSEQIAGTKPEHLLPKISLHLLGSSASFFLALSIILSCITTAVALNNIYARYIISLFKLKEKYFPLVLLATSLISFVVSLFDFKKIAAYLAPLLEISYPGLIVLTILCIISKKHEKLKFYSFWLITIYMIIDNLYL